MSHATRPRMKIPRYLSVDRPPRWWPDDTWQPVDDAWVEIALTATDVVDQIENPGRGHPPTATIPVVIGLVLLAVEGHPFEAVPARMNELGLVCPSGSTLLRYWRNGEILDGLFAVAIAMSTADDNNPNGPVTADVAAPDLALINASMVPATEDGDWSQIVEQTCRSVAYDWNAWACWLRSQRSALNQPPPAPGVPLESHSVTEHTEQAVAADVIIRLVHHGMISKADTAAAGAHVGVGREALAAAIDRHRARGDRYRTFTTLRYVYSVEDPPGTPPRPQLSAQPRPQPRPQPPVRPQTERRDPDPVAARTTAVREGFYLPSGEHVEYLRATAAQHRSRAGWLRGAIAIANAAIDFHESAAAAIESAGVACLANLPETARPALPAAATPALTT